ncbi:MAG: glycoside hydrolase family 43 protein [Bryobacteraceae bacterium]|nr:glycoside hydrolase family 43 protein [Bryobacteraceae bacterium]MCX7604343.1 glycoside hydrolase family 43 protein [Bryobacteraceae bacterium]
MKPAAILFAFLSAAFAADPLLFTSFRGNGETGVYLALSEDGRHWTPVRNGQPVLRPEISGMLMRDPFLARGPDGRWHMLWTTGWTRSKQDGSLTIGHASSPDLVQWSPQRLIPIPLDGARNAWAPEAVWHPKQKVWIVFWASTIPGRFPEGEASGDQGYNHRIWAMRTRDFQTFTAPELFFDPGFNVIDSTIVRTGRRWLMVFKDERREPLKKNLRLAWAEDPAGPWRAEPETFTKSWIEGPSVIRIGRDWFVYFDHYGKPQHYGAYRTRDWKRFEDVTAELRFPPGHRHGTVVRIRPRDAARLRALE